MLTVYSKETTSFSTLGLGVLTDFISNPLVTEELNGVYTLEFEYAKDGYLSEYLVEQNIIKAKGQPFRIWNVKKDMKKITILAKHIFFDLGVNFLTDVYPKNLTAVGALEWILDRAAVQTNFTVSGSSSVVASARYVRKTITDAIFNDDNALVKRFGCELTFDNYNIAVSPQRGSNANFSIRYKKNLTGINFNLDFSEVATRIVPVGFDGLTIDNVYVESSRVGNYFTPLYKKCEFSDIKYDPEDEEAYQTLEEAKQALEDAAIALFDKGVDIPQISISVNFVELSKCSEYENYTNLESVNLGDTINVVVPELNINTTARVNKTIYDCVLERYITLEIGSSRQSITTTQIKIENEIKKGSNVLADAKKSAENLINHPFNGNIYIDKETGVIYLMDTTEPSTAQNVWKWSLGGLGYSSTGINGTYDVAITQDGHIVADFITVGTIDISRINGLNGLLETITGDVSTLQTETYTKTDINKIVSGEGVDGVKVESVITETGKFDIDGLLIEKTNAKTKGRFNEIGMTITDATGSDDQELLFAGYNETLNETIVRSKNIKVTKYLTIGTNSRIEDFEDGTGIFYVG